MCAVVMCCCCMAPWSSTDRDGTESISVTNTCCVWERKRQFRSSLNFQKSWWSSENWTNCSNATLILCYSKCKLVSQKLFLITLCQVNLLCGNFSMLPLSIALSHEPWWLVWFVLLIHQSPACLIDTLQVLSHASLIHCSTVGQEDDTLFIVHYICIIRYIEIYILWFFAIRATLPVCSCYHRDHLCLHLTHLF